MATNSATVSATSSSPADRRRHERHQTGNLVFCSLGKSSQASQFRAHAIDVSQSGACLLLPMEMRIGEDLFLEFLSSKSSRVTFSITSKVRWINSTVPGQWKLGCEFTQPLALSDLVALFS